MAEVTEVLEAALDAYRQRDWSRAYECFTAVGQRVPLTPEDLDALSDACWWLGRVDDCLEAGEAVRGYVDAERPGDAAMCALDVAVSLLLRGDEVVGSGWIGRAQRLLEELPEQPAHGYVCYLVEVEAGLGGDDLDAVAAAARKVREIGRRHGDPNLVAAGVLGEGRALLKLGDVARGSQLLDEAMIAVLHDCRCRAPGRRVRRGRSGEWRRCRRP